MSFYKEKRVGFIYLGIPNSLKNSASTTHGAQISPVTNKYHGQTVGVAEAPDEVMLNEFLPLSSCLLIVYI